MLQFRAPPAGSEEREVGGGAVGIDVGEPAGQETTPARRLQGRLHVGGDTGVQLLEAVPGHRRLEGVDDAGQRHQGVAAIRRPQKGVAPGPDGALRRP